MLVDFLFSDFDGMSCKGFDSYWEKESDHLTIKIEAPGIKREQIDIKFSNNILEVTGKYPEKSIREGTFSNKWKIENIDCDAIDAKLEDGVLTIILPYLKESLAKKIEIK